MVAISQERVKLSCKAKGLPKPLITWKRKDKKEMSGKWSLARGELIFEEVVPETQGIYVCEAKNDLNTITAETKLSLILFTVTPPSLITGPEQIWIRLDCQTNKNSNITWQRIGGYLPNGHMLYSNGSLLLKKVSTSHSGRYVCTANYKSKLAKKESQVFIGNLTCSHIKKAHPEAPSGNYSIDPDSDGGEEPFAVFCDMEDKNGIGVTVIDHDSEEKNDVTGCNNAGCFMKNLTYNIVTKSQLDILKTVSVHCEQFVKFECNGLVPFIEEKAAWWITLKGRPMFYLGGAAPTSKKCACGMSQTCVGGGLCNCKRTGPRSRRSDSGLLTNKFTLPVAGLRFGGRREGDGESYYSVGKFKCHGVYIFTGMV